MPIYRDMRGLTENVGGDSPRSGPTALRILVGSQLRRLREEKKITREQAGYAIRGSHSKISRMEGGRCGFKARDVAGRSACANELWVIGWTVNDYLRNRTHISNEARSPPFSYLLISLDCILVE